MPHHNNECKQHKEIDAGLSYLNFDFDDKDKMLYDSIIKVDVPKPRMIRRIILKKDREII